MNWPNHCVAIIPCFNEAAHIGEVIANVRRHLPNIIVVDDNSTDATSKNAIHSGAQIVRLKKNSGKGSALRAGWQRARESGFIWTLMLDGDGQHSADDIPRFFDCAEITGAKLVIGNRMENCETMPRLRHCVNRWMSRQISKLTGLPLPDSQCGFRLGHLETLLRLPITAGHFEIESEMLVAFAAAGHKIKFVPVQTIYKTGASKILPFTDTFRWFRWRLAQRKTHEILLAPTAVAKTFSCD